VKRLCVRFAAYIIARSYPILTRFFAHLCLFLQMIDNPVSPLAMQSILEAYLQVLEVRPSIFGALHALF
jgi:hypothetical protein